MRENASWQRESPEIRWGLEDVEGSLGVDPARSVVIAGLGPDMPVVLDYRTSRHAPRVTCLRTSSRPWVWTAVAAGVDELAARLWAWDAQGRVGQRFDGARWWVG